MRGENGSTDLEERHELREALIEALDENTSDKESEITARPRRSRRVTAASRSSRATASDESLSDTRNRARGVTEGSPSSLSSTDSSFLSIHPLGSTSSPGGFPESVWSIHYSEPPASSVFRPSLVTYALLMEHGISMEKTVGSFIMQCHLTDKLMLMQIEALERYAAITQIMILDDVFSTAAFK